VRVRCNVVLPLNVPPWTTYEVLGFKSPTWYLMLIELDDPLAVHALLNGLVVFQVVTTICAVPEAGNAEKFRADAVNLCVHRFHATAAPIIFGTGTNANLSTSLPVGSELLGVARFGNGADRRHHLEHYQPVQQGMTARGRPVR